MATPLTRVDYRRRVYRAMDLISANLDRELGLDEVAAAAAFSPFHFHRIFRAVAGETVGGFGRRLRLEAAAGRLVAARGRSVTAIAHSLGFSSSQNFARAFRNAYGRSPSEYRGGAGPRPGAGAGDRPAGAPAHASRAEPLGVAVGEVTAARAAGVRRLGLGPEACASAFAELLGWAAGRSPGPEGPPVALYWDNPEITPPEKCRFDCCVPYRGETSPADPVFIREIWGGTWATCSFAVLPDGFPDAWERAFEWLVGSGYECRPVPCHEVYRSGPPATPGGAWHVDIAIPLVAE